MWSDQLSKGNILEFGNSRKGFSQKNATKDQLEETARICEQFTEVFPVLFPQNHITRKMHVLSIVAPMQIRQQGIVYKIE